jgi:biopolymer transport protein ExbB/TolQ
MLKRALLATAAAFVVAAPAVVVEVLPRSSTPRRAMFNGG